jgi:RNA polymerase sigma factor (sigma-70 family)
VLDRNALFHDNLAWAAVIARNVHRKLPPSFDLCDLEQVARIEMWRRVQMYDPATNDSFQGFAYLPVRGACLMSVRRRAFKEATHESLTIPRKGALPDNSNGGMQDAERPVPDTRPNPEQIIQQRERNSQHRIRLLTLLHLIKTLPVEQAYVIRRVYLNDVDVETVARAWGVPRAQVTRQLSYAITALRKAANGAAPAKQTYKKSGWLFLGSGKMRAVCVKPPPRTFTNPAAPARLCVANTPTPNFVREIHPHSNQ